MACLRIRAVGPSGVVDASEAGGPPWKAEAWYVLADADASLHPDLADVLRRFGAERPDLHVVYGDGTTERAPAFDGTRLIAQDYIGLPIAVRGAAMAALGGLDPDAATAAAYDLLLRALAGGLEIGRIPQVLGTSAAAAPTAEDRMRARRRAVADLRPGCEVVPGLSSGTGELRATFAAPPAVTLLILPDRALPSGAPSLPDRLSSLLQADWPPDRLRILLADEVAPPTASLAARVNQLWRQSETDQVVLLDPGLLPDGPGWLRALMSFAAEEGIGGVAPRLLDPDGAAWDEGGIGLWPGANTVGANTVGVQHERPVVAGHAFATRCSVLDHANGWDERLGFGAAQADLCLRLRMLGWRIVHTPHAPLMQRNLAPLDPPGAEQTALFLEKWQHALPGTPPPDPEQSGPAWWRVSAPAGA